MNDPNDTTETWLTAPICWKQFVERHPELGLGSSMGAFHNFMRRHKAAMLEADALRLANRKHWIGQPERFERAAFAALTAPPPWLIGQEGAA
jgi:hypothetical protein